MTFKHDVVMLVLIIAKYQGCIWGGIVPCPPPLGRQDCKIAWKSKQNLGMAPSFASWA